MARGRFIGIFNPKYTKVYDERQQGFSPQIPFDRACWHGMNETADNRPRRLAVVLSHPIQYFSPWFQYIAQHSSIELKVFYLWDFGVENRVDRSFGHALKWDIPLLEGYEYEFIPNKSRDPGTHHFSGLDNPGLVPALKAWQPDAILMFGYNYSSHLKVLLSWSLRKIPILQRGDSHDLARAPGLKPKWNRFLRSILFKRFAAFLSVGKANADYLRNSGVPESRIYFAPHCIDNQRFQSARQTAEQDAAVWRRELGMAADVKVILFAGKFEANKRPLDLINAFKLAMKRLSNDREPKAALLMVGAGELETALRECAADEVGRTIFFAGFQNQTRMPTVYALGDVLVLPSWNETWGLAINEAMNLARPVIVSSQVGCGPDLVLNEKTGWVFSAGNVDELATILQRVISMSDGDLQTMGQSAFDHVQSYSYEAACTSLLQAFHEIRQ